jgi:hypothetical protein
MQGELTRMEGGWLDVTKTLLNMLANAQIRPDPYLGSVVLVAEFMKLCRQLKRKLGVKVIYL